MAETLLQVYSDVARAVNMDPTITAFSETDGSADIVQFIYEGVRSLRRKLSQETIYTQKTATISAVNGTRTYSLPTDAEPYDVYSFGVYLDSVEGNPFLAASTRNYIRQTDGKWDTTEGQPKYYYFEDKDTIAFYPVPDASYTVKVDYRQGISEDTATTATFLYPDEWLDYVKKYAQYQWEKLRGFGSAEGTYGELLDILHSIRVQIHKQTPGKLVSSRSI